MPLGEITELELADLATKVVKHIEGDQGLTTRLATLVIQAATANPDIAAQWIDLIADQLPQSVLSTDKVLEGISEGYVIIDPFNEDRLKTSSYDVALGEWYWTTRRLHPGRRVFNPHNSDHVRNLWQGPKRAQTVREYLLDPPSDFRGVLVEDDFAGLREDDPVIILAPGETILAHTEEFIGGRDKVTSMMKARSSWGRAFLSVCKDAGWGDVGYFNRWTMEIQNNLQEDWSIVPVGQPIAQMIFFRVFPVSKEQYSLSGNYQSAPTLHQLKERWSPEQMLPRLTRKPSRYG